MNADLKSSELTSGGESGFPMTRRALFYSRPVDIMVTSGSLAGNSVVGEGPVGFILLSSDKVVCSGSKARAGMIVDP